MTDPVLVVLGGAVVKAAVRLWVGPGVVTDELTADLGDLLQSRVSDAVERRKLRRRFEEMEDMVADQVLAAMRNEFRSVDEGERNAAVAAVADTFGRARVSGKELFSADLDPLNLERYVRRYTRDLTRDLSWGGTQLYDRVLSLCCAYILEIADKLPRFQSGAFGELLRRDTQILARLEDVLDRLPAPAKDGAAGDLVDTAYRQRIVKVFDRLELFGLDFAAQWYALSVAYVNLRVSGRPASTDDAISADASLEEWLARHPRLLIEGRAGGGKTTILQWIAVRAARRDFTGPASQFNGHVPFFIRLREYVGRPLPAPEDFLDSVAPRLLPKDDRGWPRDQLLTGRAFLLIDGIDELPEAQRPTVVTWVGELTEYFPDVRCVMTTRPTALEPGALSQAGFATADLEPMDPGLVRVFVDRWHDAMAQWQIDADSAARLAGQHGQLRQTLENDRFLRELADTPLLAGLICALNQHLDGRLPRRRGEIFEQALAMFHDRDHKRNIASDVTIDLDATNHLLGDLALWMVRNAVIEVAADSAFGTIQRSAESLPTGPYSAKALYRHLLLRSGLLREPAAGHVDFVHRAFQEYLAAKALIKSDYVGELVRNSNDDQWRDIVILASGLGNTRQTTDLLRGLLGGIVRGKQRRRRRALAVSCLDEIRSADPGVLADLDAVIPDLFPPRSEEDAEALSYAASRLLPHVERFEAKVSSLSLHEVVPSIRLAGLIGGPRAIDLITQLARQAETASGEPVFKNYSLTTEIHRAWQYFPAREYAEKVIIPYEFTSVTVNSIQQLQAIYDVAAIGSIELHDFVGDGANLSALDGMRVSELTLDDCPAHTLAGVMRRWPHVKMLQIRGCDQLVALASLEELINLENLQIIHCERLSNYASLAHLSSLVEIKFQGQQNPDLSPIAALPKLDTIAFAFIGKVDLRPLAGMNLRVRLHNVQTAIFPATSSGKEFQISSPEQVFYLLDSQEIRELRADEFFPRNLAPAAGHSTQPVWGAGAYASGRNGRKTASDSASAE